MDTNQNLYLNYGYDVIIVNFEQLLRDFIEDIIIEYHKEDWKTYIPDNIFDYLEDKPYIQDEDLDNITDFLSKTYITHLKKILLKHENFLFIQELCGNISRAKFSRLMNLIIQFRNKIAHRNNFSQLEFSKAIEAVKELCKGTYSKKLLEYIENQGYLNAKAIPEGFFEKYECQNNLPREEYELTGGFVGREKEIEKIINYIESEEDRIFTLTGVGGAGKTAIALKVAYIFLNSDEQLFEAIIWFSAKKDKLTDEGIIQIEPQISNAEKLIKDFMKLLDLNQYDIFKSAEVPLESWKKHLYNIFRSQKCLIIIDNLETIYTEQEIINFITETPRPSCVIITSRKGLGMLERPIPIGNLSEDEAVELFKLVSQSKNLEDLIKLEEIEIRKLVNNVKCYPLLIKWAIGQYSLGKPIDKAFNSYISGESEIAKFAFNDVFQLLSDNAKKILYSLIIFGTEGITRYLIQHLTLLSEEDFADAINELIISSLVYTEEINDENQTQIYYNIHSLTRGFLESKLNEDTQTKLFLLNRYYDQIKELEKSIAVYHQTVFSLGIKTVEEKIAFNFIKSAKTNIESDNEKEAENCFKEATKVAPNLDYVWTEFSKFEYLRKNHAKSLEYAKKAVKLGNENFHTWWNYGSLLSKTGNYHEAIEILKQAKKLNPDFLPIYSELGYTYSILGLYELAEEEYNQALREEKHPNFKHKMFTLINQADNYLKLSQAYQQREDYNGELSILKKAEHSIKQALEINPSRGKAIKVYREICFALGNAYGYKNNAICFEYLEKAKENITFNLSENKASQSLREKVEDKILIFKERINRVINNKKINGLSKITDTKSNLLDFNDAVNTLIEVLEKGAIQGKSTRFLVIDNLMRNISQNKYQGSRSVRDPNTGREFKSFSKFIDCAEEKGIVRTEIINGFKETFLIESGQDAISTIENNHESIENYVLSQNISRKDWSLIINSIIEALLDKSPEQYMRGRFLTLLKSIRLLKTQKIIPYSNQRLREAINDLIDVGFLVKQDDGTFRLIDDYKENQENYIDKLMKKQEEL